VIRVRAPGDRTPLVQAGRESPAAPVPASPPVTPLALTRQTGRVLSAVIILLPAGPVVRRAGRVMWVVVSPPAIRRAVARQIGRVLSVTASLLVADPAVVMQAGRGIPARVSQLLAGRAALRPGSRARATRT
jgi:hypothetical protein